MTDVGNGVLPVCAGDAAQLRRRRRSGSTAPGRPSGVIRLTTAVEIAQFALREILPVFLEPYPKVQHRRDRDRPVRRYRGRRLRSRDTQGTLPRFKTPRWYSARWPSVPWYLLTDPGTSSNDRVQTARKTSRSHATHRDDAQRVAGAGNCGARNDRGSRHAHRPALSKQQHGRDERGSLRQPWALRRFPGYICRSELRRERCKMSCPTGSAADARISALDPVSHRTASRGAFAGRLPGRRNSDRSQHSTATQFASARAARVCDRPRAWTLCPAKDSS